MKLYLFISLFVLFQYSFAQNDPIELIEKIDGDNVVLVAKNTSDFDLNINLNLKLENATINVKTPINRTIEAGKEEIIGNISVVDIYEKWNYNPTLTYERDIQPIDLMANKDTIILFTMTDCGRCDYALDYLNHHEFNFVEYNTTRHFEHTMIMWNTLKAANFNVRDIRMPVIIVNGEVSFNIKSLPTFMEALKPSNDVPVKITSSP